jgi:hypothetical protein
LCLERASCLGEIVALCINWIIREVMKIEIHDPFQLREHRGTLIEQVMGTPDTFPESTEGMTM